MGCAAGHDGREGGFQAEKDKSNLKGSNRGLKRPWTRSRGPQKRGAPIQMHHLMPLNITAFLAASDTSEAADAKVSHLSQKIIVSRLKEQAKGSKQRQNISQDQGHQTVFHRENKSLTEPSTVKGFARIFQSKYAHCVICYHNPESFQQDQL